jgi:ribose transport system substrate-binding protein
MFRQRFSFVALLLVAMLGCSHESGNSGAGDTAGKTDSGKPAAGKKFRIAVIPKGTSHSFWKSVEAGARKAEKEFGVEIAWKGPTGEGDTGEQIKIVENFLAGGYDGICLAPLDGTALRKPVDEALANKVPVVIFDSKLADLTGVTSFVATNSLRGGQRAGAYMAELLGGKGRVIVMRYQINSVSTEEREKGFLDAIAKFKDITVLSSDKHGGPDEQAAISLGENLLATYGDQVDGIFCPNESTASGMLTALERDSRGLAGKVKFVGFDSSDNLARGLKEGHLMATVLQDPVQMGYDAVRVTAEKLAGKTVPEKIEVPETLATTSNLNDPKIQALLYPKKVE